MSDKISYVTLTIGLVLCLVMSGCSISPHRVSQVPLANPPKVLVIGLDGIPYSTFKKLQDGGHFRNFQNVSPMVASFPSISDPNWDKLFDLGPEPGFTKAFFDPTVKTSNGMGQESGSVLAHLSRHPIYEEAVDFKPEGALEHLSTYIWTQTTGAYWLEELERNFFGFSKGGRDTYFALIINSDLLSHTEGELSLMNFLSQIEDRTEKIQNRYKKLYGSELDIILVSDHGNGFFSPKDIDFVGKLKPLGWSFKETLSKPQDVAFFVPEILSFGAFYSLESSKKKLALDLSRIEEVQSTMYQSEGEIHILARAGLDETILKYDPKLKLLSYRVLKGHDPLGHIEYFKTQKLNSDSYFIKTLETPYPNALVRIWEGFNTNSKTKPSVMVNPKLGWVFGNTALRLITDIRGFASSHGSLHRDESEGIFVSTKRDFPPIRATDFRNYVDVKQLKGFN
jgi:hypothetical protein